MLVLLILRGKDVWMPISIKVRHSDSGFFFIVKVHI